MIIRRMLKCSAVVGRHIEVTKRTKSGYYGHYVGEHNEFYIAETLKSFVETKVISIQINAIEFEALKHALCIYHDVSVEWNRAVTEDPEIIKFWNRNGGVIYVWPYVIKRKIFGHSPQIFIDIKSKIYVSNS